MSAKVVIKQNRSCYWHSIIKENLRILSIWIIRYYNAIITIGEQIPLNYAIGINKSIPIGVIIPASEIVESGFYIIDIPPIAERLDDAQRGSEGAGGRENLAPRVIRVFYHLGSIAVNQSQHVAL